MSVQQPSSQQAPSRPRTEKLSDAVVDTNPYSRLMALQRMGIVKNYEHIRSCTVAVVGMGGVGSVAAEMLTRCGIGRLLMYDYDKVELANMNRLFFRPEHCGMTKTDAAAVTLAQINPDVALEPFTMNITTLKGFDAFKASLTHTDTGKSRVDLVLACVDNYEARITINQVCLELGQIWMESGVSEDAVSGHIQVIIPGDTACFECVPPLVVASGIDERTLKREGVCAASLPTTMGIVAGLLVQNVLKHLLGFGQVTRYLGYASLQDYFPTMAIRPNPECINPLCRQSQAAFKVKAEQEAALQAASAPEEAAPAKADLHEANEWGIEVVADEPSGPAASRAAAALPQGLEYSMPVASMDASNLNRDAVESNDDKLEDLMAQLNAMSK
ncbi:hypothetical protein WJX73_010785 [Symbiochloris irregularis]|uniref:Ubiquitin-like modifier-activating enzyme 5 n=1 Tax=Symbiochloris irregularis TaxID=706552 RepID=A0AAW1PRV8_9CHLO